MKKIVVMCSGGGTNFQAILDAIDAGTISGYVSLMISSSKFAGAIARAEAHNIRALTLSKAMFDGDTAALGNARHDALMCENPDLIVLAGFLGILPKKTIAAFPNAIINTHPALIPAFCGKGMYGHHVHEAVLNYGAKISGATVHFVDEGTDTGPIIAQKSVPVYATDTTDALAARVLTAEHSLLPNAVKAFCQDELTVENRQVLSRTP